MDYATREKADYDKLQTKLSKEGCKPNTNHYAEIPLKYDYNTMVLCPFCLSYNPIYLFPKKGRMRLCVNCQNQMLISTFVKDMTPEQFAQWVYNYRLNGFWQKINQHIKDRNEAYNKWCKRLKDLGISYQFWDKYKELRGDIEENEKE